MQGRISLLQYYDKLVENVSIVRGWASSKAAVNNMLHNVHETYSITKFRIQPRFWRCFTK